MDITVFNQLTVFGWCALCGVVAAFIFDLFKILRRLVKTGTAAAVIEDIAYWIIAAAVFFAFVLQVNSGEVRFYQFAAAALGAGIYIFTISRFVVIAAVRVIRFVHRAAVLVLKTVAVPVSIVVKVVRKPVFIVLSFGRRGGIRMRRRVGASISNFGRYIKKI